MPTRREIIDTILREEAEASLQRQVEIDRALAERRRRYKAEQARIYRQRKRTERNDRETARLTAAEFLNSPKENKK
jgi:hypothetical protein